MLQQLRIATLQLIALTILTGVIYPVFVTVLAQVAWPWKASGSLLQSEGKSVGSEWIGQSFSKPEYMWGRLSATGPVPYNAGASSGSNYGPLHPGLKSAAEARIAALKAAGITGTNVPVDLVTASGSGLDPHISPAAAEFQVPRIAQSRKLSEEVVRNLVLKYTQGRQFGILGEPCVNVLQFNLALDQQHKQ